MARELELPLATLLERLESLSVQPTGQPTGQWLGQQTVQRLAQPWVMQWVPLVLPLASLWALRCDIRRPRWC